MSLKDCLNKEWFSPNHIQDENYNKRSNYASLPPMPQPLQNRIHIYLSQVFPILRHTPEPPALWSSLRRKALKGERGNQRYLLLGKQVLDLPEFTLPYLRSVVIKYQANPMPKNHIMPTTRVTIASRNQDTDVKPRVMLAASAIIPNTVNIIPRAQQT